MSRLLDPVRALVADLIRKRLWPVALVLVIALVAVPALIASSSSEAPTGTAAVTPAPPAPAPATMIPEGTPKAEPERGGRVRDPFFDPPATPSEGTGSARQPAAPSAGARAKSGEEEPEARAKANATPAGPAKPKSTSPANTPPIVRSAPVTGTYHRATARLGWAADATAYPLARLTPIGGRSDPAALYLGVMKIGRQYAVFVLGSDATSSGDATCAAETRCRIIGLRPGDEQTVRVHAADGRIARRYVLRVTSLKRVRTSAAHARTMRAKVHPLGLSAMRAMSRSTIAWTLGRVGYRRSTGLLYAIAAAETLEKATP